MLLLLLCCALAACLVAQGAALPAELRCLYAEGVPQLCRVEGFVLLPGQVRLAVRSCAVILSINHYTHCCRCVRQWLCRLAREEEDYKLV